ncbi:hypothetical protein MKS88_002543 [Plasmodium brasilianum]|uniref:Uncharacterized protein n=2 Tax=Plasmodium (Plasmodium) TaxID=418103 RepID=A0A1A8X783_PLAMA|nr:conserved Plasmodium protein, unknown function [Plasmodium malariae]KAI4839031.1 hypothetical protein MKS88_002543 [Plasmodium brasilianum]SBT01119.1 hypothetical protein PMALA_080060 [Plasmodium malariae]SCN12383.1 conserved Plasmodium protein, unknown function [Plasmodium malariae]
MNEQILFDNFPLTFLNNEINDETFEDTNEKNYRETIKVITEKLKQLRIEISEKHSIRSMLEEKLSMLKKEEHVKQNNINYMMNFCENNNIYEREIINYQNNLDHIKKQIQNSKCKIKLLLEKEFKVRKQLQLSYMQLYDLLNDRIQYIINDYVKHRKCACAIYAYQQENKDNS